MVQKDIHDTMLDEKGGNKTGRNVSAQKKKIPQFA